MQALQSTLVNQSDPNGQGNRGYYDPATYAVFPARRPVQLGVPFFLPLHMNTAASGVVNENLTGQIETNFNNDVLVLGCETDWQTAKVQFSLPGTLPQIWSQFQVPVKSLCGSPDTARPVFWFPYPLPLKVNRRIQAQVTNVNGESGDLIFLFNCAQPTSLDLRPLQQYDEYARGLGPTQLDPRRLGPLQIIPIDSKFTNIAADATIGTINTVDPVDYDFLLQGFYTDLTLASIRITDCEQRRWSTEFVPVWSISSRQASQLNVQFLRVPYFVPQQQMLTVEFRDDATTRDGSGQLYMVGQQLLDL